MNDELDTLTDEELNKVFAREILGWRAVRVGRHFELHGDNGYKHAGLFHTADAALEIVDDFATDANAVLPFFDSGMASAYRDEDAEWSVNVKSKSKNPAWDYESLGIGRAKTFPRAACIALIRAKRAQTK